MRGMIRHSGVFAALLVAGCVVPSIVSAQTTTPEKLEARAKAYLNSGRGVGKAAGLFAKASHFRSPTDPIGVGDMIAAASGYYYSGQPVKAREISEQAGERALAMGDVDRAAHAFLFAAIVANQQGDVEGRDELIARANGLAASPLLSPAQRYAIQAQFESAKLPVQVASTPKP